MKLKQDHRRVTFLVTNCICNDNRVRKIASLVKESGSDVTIIGRKSGQCTGEEIPGFKIVRLRMIFKRGFFFYAFFNIRLFFRLLFRHNDIIVANDLDTLLPAYLVSTLKKSTLVYDSHEYFTGVQELQDRPLIKWVWKTIERMVFPKLKYVMTVSDSIAALYEEEYGIRPLTVRNCAPGSGAIANYSHEELGVGSDDLLVILQGTGINAGRGGMELAEAIATTAGITLLIVGNGDMLPDIRKKVAEAGADRKVRFLPPMPWHEMMRYTKSADAGISPDRATNINNMYSLPNKLFDYISAGIPVIAGPLKEVRNILEAHNCGIIVPEINADELARALIFLRDDREKLQLLKKNASKASEILSWEKESMIVTGFYSGILGNK